MITIWGVAFRPPNGLTAKQKILTQASRNSWLWISKNIYPYYISHPPNGGFDKTPMKIPKKNKNLKMNHIYQNAKKVTLHVQKSLSDN